MDTRSSLCTGAGGEIVGGECVVSDGGASFTEIFTSFIDILLFASVVAAGIFIIVGGFNYITSAGDAQKVESAKRTIQYALIGLVLAFLALGISTFVANNLLSNEPEQVDCGGVGVTRC